MNKQINVRMSEKLLKKSESYAKRHGYNTIQELVKEAVREKVYDEADISKKEFRLIKKFLEVANNDGLFGTEKQLFDKVRKK